MEFTSASKFFLIATVFQWNTSNIVASQPVKTSGSLEEKAQDYSSHIDDFIIQKASRNYCVF